MGYESWFGKKVGLVLNGGGGKGAYQIGAFKAIRESGLNELVTAISGSSVGALNMCLFNYDEGTVGEEIWSNISPENFVDPDLELIDGKEGCVSRDGLLDILNDYIDLNKIRNNPLELYASVSEYENLETTVSKGLYLKLNGCSDDRIRKILLASSSMPIIYEPVQMDGLYYRDGGMTDNLPIRPLYDAGVRNFIVILLSKECEVPTHLYPGSEFMIIRPSKKLGDLVTGTLDFSPLSAKERMQLGYIDAARTIRFFGNDNVDVARVESIELRQYENKLKVDHAMDSADSNMSKLNDLLNKYM